MSSWSDLTSHWSLLTLTDWATVVYILLLILAVILSNWLFVGFVDSKPEGRKTVLGEEKIVQLLLTKLFSAKVNVTISITGTVSTIVVWCPLVLRIIFGSFHKILVIGYYYLSRFIATYILSLLTFRSALMIAFLLDFERASGTL